MGIIKRRPTIRLLVPRALEVGASHHARVVLEARRPVPIDWLRAEVTGVERATVGSGQYARTRRAMLLRLDAQLSGARELPAGRTEFPLSFDLPPDLPPSHDGPSAKIGYAMTLRASIPWWPDAKAAFELRLVLPPAPSAPRDRPVLFSSQPDGPAGREPYLEGSLASSLIEAGGNVSGAVALGNVGYNNYRGVDVELVAEEAVKLGDRRASRQMCRYRVQPEVAGLQEGGSVDFQFRLPSDAAPSFSSELLAVVWHLEVRARVRWRADVRLRLPVVVLPPGVAAPTRVFRAPPVVGSERMERIWRAVAAERGLRYEQGVLRRDGEVEVEVRREHRGRPGIFVVGELRYPELGLDLEVEPARRIFARGSAATLQRWLDRHRIRMREMAQASAFVGALHTDLVGFGLGSSDRGAPALLARVWIEDEQARIEMRDAGQRPAKLREVVDAAVALAEALGRAREAIPAPAAMRGAVEAWQTAARRIGARLQKSNMALLGGRVGGMAARVITEWSGQQPEGVLLAIRPDPPPHAQQRAFFVFDQRGQIAGGPTLLPGGPLGELVLRIGRHARSLCLDEELRVRVATPVEDPLPLLERLGEMAQLCVQLRSSTGPFR